MGLFVAILGLVQVTGSTECPRPAEVERALAELVPPTSDSTLHRATLTANRGALIVELHHDGVPVGRRELPQPVSCADRASAAAVILAAWESEMVPGRVTAPQLPPLQVSLSRPPVVGWEIGAAFLSSLAGSNYAAGGEVSALMTRYQNRWSARIAAFGTGTRREDSVSGHADWTHFGFSLGPQVRLSPSRVRMDFHAAITLGMIWANSLSSQHQLTAFDLGLGGGARLAVKLGPVAPFLGAGVVGWPIPQSVIGVGVGHNVDLPRFEVLLTAGLAYGNPL